LERFRGQVHMQSAHACAVQTPKITIYSGCVFESLFQETLRMHTEPCWGHPGHTTEEGGTMGPMGPWLLHKGVREREQTRNAHIYGGVYFVPLVVKSYWSERFGCHGPLHPDIRSRVPSKQVGDVLTCIWVVLYRACMWKWVELL